MPKVSLIIPVYGVEKFIERCTISLMEQTLEDIQFVVVNDCTKDRSMDIFRQVISKYPKRITQIKIIENEQNGGLAFARKRGIQEAEGDYIVYCDSDDWVEPDFCEKLYHKAIQEDADVVACNFYESLNGGNEYVVHNRYHTNNPRQVIHDIYVHKIPTFGWMHLMKRSIFVEHSILPFDGIDSGEDLNVLFRILFFANKIVHIDKPLYHYERRTGSISLTNDYLVSWNKYITKNISGLEHFIQQQNAEEEFTITLNYLKFQKKMFLLNGDNPQLKLWYKTWPESNKDISKFTSIPKKTRMIYGICSKSYALLWLYFKVFRKLIS